MAEVITIPYAPRDVFMPLHERAQRYACVVAHRRCGKTVACINDLIYRALTQNKNDFRGAYVAPFYNQAKAVAWDYVKRFTQPLPGVRYNEAELRVDMPNGARIQLFGADNADRLRGLYFDELIADEYGDWKPSVWPYVIRPALADRQGGAIVIGTPKGKNAFYEVWKRSKSDPNWLTLTLRISDTQLLPADEIKALKADLSEDAWRQEMECDFEAAIPGAYYGKEVSLARDQGRICKVAYQEGLPVYTAWDIGWSDDTAIWFFQVAGGEIHVIDYYATHNEPIEHYARALIDRGYRYGKHYLPHDARAKTLASGGRSIIEQLGDWLDIKTLAIAPHLDLQDGIQAARLAFPRIWFDAERCNDGIEALTQYQREYDEDKKCFREKPRHDWTSHAADAFRYMCVAWKEEGSQTTPQPRVLAVGAANQVTMNDLWRMAPRGSSRRI